MQDTCALPQVENIISNGMFQYVRYRTLQSSTRYKIDDFAEFLTSNVHKYLTFGSILLIGEHHFNSPMAIHYCTFWVNDLNNSIDHDSSKHQEQRYRKEWREGPWAWYQPQSSRLGQQTQGDRTSKTRGAAKTLFAHLQMVHKHLKGESERDPWVWFQGVADSGGASRSTAGPSNLKPKSDQLEIRNFLQCE